VATVARHWLVVTGNCFSVISQAAVLTIADAIAPDPVAVLAPTGGGFWLLSTANTPSTKLVTWLMSDNVRICRVAVSLQYSNDGGTSYIPAAAGGGLP